MQPETRYQVIKVLIGRSILRHNTFSVNWLQIDTFKSILMPLNKAPHSVLS